MFFCLLQEYIHSSTSIQYQTSSHPEAPPSPSLPSSSPYHSLTPYPGPPSLKLPLAPVVSNGSIGRNRGIASSFNSLMGSMGLSSTKQVGLINDDKLSYLSNCVIDENLVCKLFYI